MKNGFRNFKNKIDKINLNYYWNIAKGILTVIGIIILLGIFILTVFLMSDLIRQDSSAAGVFGTLFGAVVGGVFSLFGVIIVQSRQIKVQANIKRKNEIYKPLYDELIITNGINIDKKYPFIIAYEGVYDQYTEYPIYAEWGRINKDSRSLEVLPFIAEKFDELYNHINDYTDKFKFAELAVVEKILEVLEVDNKGYNESEKTYIKQQINSVKSQILQNILLEDKSKFDGSEWCFTYVDVKNDFNSATENDKILGCKAYSECLELPEIVKVRESFKEWMKLEHKVLKMLEKLIKTINLKYES